MCGIFGVITKQTVNPIRFEKSLSTLKRRGPDGSNNVLYKTQSGQICLGHTRLAIIDTSSGGRQPMVSTNNRYTLIFNGEIYNFREIRETLAQKGYDFRSQSDSEVLLAAFEEYGNEVTKTIVGMYAFAIYDSLQEQVHLFRDVFGEKPLFYFYDSNQFIFSSEATAIREYLGSKQKLSLNLKSILQFYVFGFIPSPNSIFIGLNKLKPAAHVTFNVDSWNYTITESSHLEIKGPETFTYKNESEIGTEIEKRLNLAIKRSLISDVPVCMFLSGGIDSSLILAKALEFNTKIKAYSISFPGRKDDESLFAINVAKILGAQHEVVQMSPTDFELAAECFLNYVDEPIADAAAIPLYFLSKNVSRTHRVALGGDGGDEVFGGYLKYRAQSIIDKFYYVSSLAKVLKGFKCLPENYVRLLDGWTRTFADRQFIFGSGGFLPDEIMGLSIYNDFAIDSLFEEFRKEVQSIQNLDLINRSMFLDCRFQLSDWYLVKSDRATMANGVELRSPMLDQDVARLMFSIPGNLKIRHGESKYFLKKALEKYLPHEMIYRPKLGFSVDIETWLLSKHFKDMLMNFKDENLLSKDKLDLCASSLSPLKLMRIAFMNHFLDRLDRE